MISGVWRPMVSETGNRELAHVHMCVRVFSERAGVCLCVLWKNSLYPNSAACLAYWVWNVEAGSGGALSETHLCGTACGWDWTLASHDPEQVTSQSHFRPDPLPRVISKSHLCPDPFPKVISKSHFGVVFESNLGHLLSLSDPKMTFQSDFSRKSLSKVTLADDFEYSRWVGGPTHLAQLSTRWVVGVTRTGTIAEDELSADTLGEEGGGALNIVDCALPTLQILDFDNLQNRAQPVDYPNLVMYKTACQGLSCPPLSPSWPLLG